jgi:CRP-like cAMP-binding protein
MSETEILEAIDLLEIPANQRKISEIMRLAALTEHVDFFRKITEDEKSNEVHMSCCQSMALELYEEGEYIVRHGEKGNKFYIILKGDVAITIPTKTKIRRPEEEQPTQEAVSPLFHVNSGVFKHQKSTEKVTSKIRGSDEDLLSKFSKIIDSKADLHGVLSQETLQEEEEDPDFLTVLQEKEVSSLHAGKSFGELALINDRPRAASVICKNRVIVAVLKKEDFKKILGAVSEKKIEKKVKFLQTIPFFSSWSKLGLYKLSYFFKSASYCKNQKVYKEGEAVSDVFIVVEGEFRVLSI